MNLDEEELNNTQEPVNEGPELSDELANEEPVSDELVNEEPVSDELVNEEPVSEEPVNVEPAAEEPEAGYGANDTEEGEATAYENGVWSGHIATPTAKPAQQELAQTVEPEVVVEPQATYYVARETAEESIEENVAEADEAEQTLAVNMEDNAAPGVNFATVANVTGANEYHVDMPLLAHLTTAIVVAVSVGVMVTTNSLMKIHRVKTARAKVIKANKASKMARAVKKR